MPEWIQEIYWDDSIVNVSLFRSQVQNSPEFTNILELTPEYEMALTDYGMKLKL